MVFFADQETDFDLFLKPFKFIIVNFLRFLFKTFELFQFLLKEEYAYEEPTTAEGTETAEPAETG